MTRAFLLTQLCAAPVFAAWMAFDLYRTDPDCFWRRLKTGLRGRSAIAR
jgi:hypothetical protein